MDYYEFVSEPRFFSYLLEIDRSIADLAHEKPCLFCRGKLHCADFWRSGYGMPDDVEEEVLRRFSFCCAKDKCRKRLTPESVRFLRGKAFTTIIIVLFSAIHQGLTPKRARFLKTEIHVSRQTMAAWIRWWRERFVPSGFWRGRRGLFKPPYDEVRPSKFLMEVFGAEQQELGAEKLLRFLAPFLPD